MRKPKGGGRRLLTLFTLLQLGLGLSTGISVVKLLQPRAALATACGGSCKYDSDCPGGSDCVCNRILELCVIWCQSPK